MSEKLPVNKFPEREKEILNFWKDSNIFELVQERRGGKPFTFFEGPPTANGMPHPGHCLTRTIKDIVLRFYTMNGFDCSRKAGWDTHGLPVEVEVCKKLNLKTKQDIETFGVDNFNKECINSVFQYKKEWEELTERLGYWIDMKDPYITFEQKYVENVWWAIKNIFDNGLLYKGKKIVWWWPEGGTALSAGEVAEGYQDTVDPSVYVKFEIQKDSLPILNLKEEYEIDKVFFLVWTTTAWSLSSNCALCVKDDINYQLVYHAENDEYYITMENYVSKNDKDFEIIEDYEGKDLKGIKYHPLFDYKYPEQPDKKFFEVVSDNFVKEHVGTGIVHLAPAFGEEDLEVCENNNIGFICYVKPDGKYSNEVTDFGSHGEAFAGKHFKEIEPEIIKVLKYNKKLYKHQTFNHSYPFCPRSPSDRLIQYTREGWFIKTTAIKDRMVEMNKSINWFPEHIKEGRFGDFLANNVDWALSRERYWGTPLPIWVCDKTGKAECISSFNELLKKPSLDGLNVWRDALLNDPSINNNLKVHKPYVDNYTYKSPFHEEGRMVRVPEVIDVWFDAGCMPFAQHGINKFTDGIYDYVNRNADFICEGIDQTRGWFYSMLAIQCLLQEFDDEPPFKNVMALGHIKGEDGLKLSKRFKNYKNPMDIINTYGADALRLSFIAKNSPTTSSSFKENDVNDIVKEYLVKWENVFNFFMTYAEMDKFFESYTPDDLITPSNILDNWLEDETRYIFLECEKYMKDYDVYNYFKCMSSLLESISNWYVRLKRNEFWKSEWDRDKLSSYSTLYCTLIEFSILSAPITPFFSEYTYLKLKEKFTTGFPSVHLNSFGMYHNSMFDATLLDNMELVRNIVSTGLSFRKENKIKLRQPLKSVDVALIRSVNITEFEDIIKSELNVHEVNFINFKDVVESIQLIPNFKKLGNKFGKNMKVLAEKLKEYTVDIDLATFKKSDIVIVIDCVGYKFQDDDVEIKVKPKDGYLYNSERNIIVSLDTNITEDLRELGIINEITRSIQSLRKTYDLKYNQVVYLNLDLKNDNGNMLKNLILSNLSKIEEPTLTRIIFDEAAFDLLIKIDETELYGRIYFN